jgi:hypothetical protein
MPGQPDQFPLIVLELELENDIVNPLYPPQPEHLLLGSPASGSTRSGSTDAGISFDSHTQSLQTDSDITTPSTGSTDSLPEVHGLDGDHDWRPSPRDVLESTTSRSKPLKALQRLRKFEPPHGPVSGRSATADKDGNPSPVRRKGRVRRNDSASSVGMMDMLALMSEINEQFGNAPDLDTFLNVVAGVVKELSQFHRVLVYQFDEAWNGFVVAELVDWSKTHDLFKGLHFPASDIPPQAGALNRILIN